MSLFLIAFFAGVLTVFTPCVLPILPVLLGGAWSGGGKWRPVIIAGSLIGSIFVFTLLLKVSTLLIMVPSGFWTAVAGVVVLIFGLTLLFPDTWTWISIKLGFEKSQQLISSASQVQGSKGLVLLGAALGPVFASCSPTYALILAVVLPQSVVTGVTALLFYSLGLFLPLLLIGYGGQRIMRKFRWFANPSSWFRRGLGLLLIVVGVLVLSGVDKKIELYLLNNGYIDFTKFDQALVESYDDGLDVTERDMDMVKKVSKDPGMLDEVMPGNLSPEAERVRKLLNVNYPAPELVDPQNWINSPPLTLAELQAERKVVMIDFWTYSCINCIRTLPALKALHQQYADQGLVIIGAHAPEFAFEHVFENVQAKVKEFALEYPVFQDNDFKTWRAYNNRFWPAKYLIDQSGHVRYTHFGEGGYEETEEVIQYLLTEGKSVKPTLDFSQVDVPSRGIMTGETYLGTERHVIAGSLASFGSSQAVFASLEDVSTAGSHYFQPADLKTNQWWLTGDWKFDGEKVVSQSSQASIGLMYGARQANLVMGFQGDPVPFEVWLDGELLDDSMMVDDFKLFFLSEHDQVEEHTIELKFQGSGVELYAWTFG
ncbi:MAG: cytochrome c biogenesis protein CcdA [Candidatus Gracilibacteria bacterium]|nr:cytochrome c biogenesis protein CcdA [bacterium]MDZ4217131.1 cytochrome c biogenesis protein CcdA [Candidatus Gracilibacteria bacterium]